MEIARQVKKEEAAFQCILQASKVPTYLTILYYSLLEVETVSTESCGKQRHDIDPWSVRLKIEVNTLRKNKSGCVSPS